jgi:hypothetical protein
MKLADQVAQFRTPFVVQCARTHRMTHLNNAADCAGEIANSPIRFVLSDDLTRLCTALAYSKGARTLACADLMRVPAERVWIEWGSDAWQNELQLYGFPQDRGAAGRGGRRGALFRASTDGRRGVLRTLWTGDAEQDVLASSLEAYFDLDTPDGEEPEPPAGDPSLMRVLDDGQSGDDILNRCFRFRYERTWSEYYSKAALTPSQSQALWRHALGTIVLDIPVVLAFLLLLGTRSGLPQRSQTFERLNRSRLRAGKTPLLDHIDVSAPLLPDYRAGGEMGSNGTRRTPRLHHVRGHLVRRGSQLFWRVPHLRGSARQGAVRTRTVTWTFERTPQTDPAATLRSRGMGGTRLVN